MPTVYKMKNHRLFWLLTTAPALLVPFASGCVFLKAPEVEPTPTPAPTPKAPYFDPTAGQPQGTVLNDPANPAAPSAFRISMAVTGDTVALQTVKVVPAGSIKPKVPPKDQINIGTGDTVKLAGIITPTVDPGLQGARTAITRWTAGQDLTVHQDPKFPAELDGRKLVQVFFKGTKGGPYDGQTLSLNRMLVRSGWAVVDLYSPTSFDTSQWLYDEAHAKKNRLGIWKYGQVIQQRLPAKVTTIRNTQSTVKLPPATRMGTTAKADTVQTGGQSTMPAPSAPIGGPSSSSASVPSSSSISVPSSSGASAPSSSTASAPGG
jgi:endonuclease YncB( thermonuclease family)